MLLPAEHEDPGEIFPVAVVSEAVDLEAVDLEDSEAAVPAAAVQVAAGKLSFRLSIECFKEIIT